MSNVPASGIRAGIPEEPIDLASIHRAVPANTSDFTVQLFETMPHYEALRGGLVPPEPLNERTQWLESARAIGQLPGSADGRTKILFSKQSDPLPARVVAASCFEGSAVALTIRLANSQRTPKTGTLKPARLHATSPLKPLDKFPIPTITTAAAFWNKLSGVPAEAGRRKADGLVVIAGSTNSGKSELMKAIVNEYLATVQCKANELLHLITCENPIEQWLSPNHFTSAIERERIAASSAMTAKWFLANGIVYTPRSLGRDVQSIRQALKDAKRQTPACFVVGEVRDAEDWKEVIDFASTGHLIVVTTHAASVREAILRVFKAVDVRRAQERRQIANALLAVAHAELVTVDYAQERRRNPNSTSRAPELYEAKQVAQLPMLWVRKASSVNHLTVDGLSSILPNGDYCLSREQFFRELPKNRTRRVSVAGQVLVASNGSSKLEDVQVPISATENVNALVYAARKRDIEELRKP